MRQMSENNLKTDYPELFAFINQCTWVWTIYEYYNSLYETNQETLDLLEDCSYDFFYDLQIILSEYLILNMCCLTDPVFSGNDQTKENLTINNLLETLPLPPEIKSTLQGKVDDLKKITEPLKDARNKIIAHADKQVYLSNQTLGALKKEEY